MPKSSNRFAHGPVLANRDERAPAGPQDMGMEVEECASGRTGVPNRHLARLLFVLGSDRIANFPKVLVGLDERSARGLPELRRGRVLRPFHERAQQSGWIIQGFQRTPAAECSVQVRPGAQDLGPRLLGRLLQDREEDAISHDVMNRGPRASNDDEHVDVGMRAFLSASHGPVHADRDEVPTLSLLQLVRQRLRKLESARGGHVRHNQEGDMSLSAVRCLYGPRANPVAMMRLTTIALVVSDAKKSAKWYTEKLGFEIRDHQGHWITVAPKNENVAFHLCEGYYPLEPGNSGISFVSKDVKKEEQALRKAGVDFTTTTTSEDWGTYAMFKDPDGNEFYILED